MGPAAATAAITRQLPLDASSYANEGAARRAIDEREVDGALVIGPQGWRLIVAPAAGNSAALALTAGSKPVAAASGQG